MKESNLTKYNRIYEELQVIGDQFISNLFPNGLPQAIYQITGLYNVDEMNIVGAYYSFGFYPQRSGVKNDLLVKIKTYRDNIPPLVSDKVYLEFECVSRLGGRVSGCRRFGEIDNVTMSFLRSDLDEEIAKRKEKYELKSGDIACAYCRRAFPELKASPYTVISVRSYGYSGKPGLYCSGQCASYDQMAHEG